MTGCQRNSPKRFPDSWSVDRCSLCKKANLFVNFEFAVVRQKNAKEAGQKMKNNLVFLNLQVKQKQRRLEFSDFDPVGKYFELICCPSDSLFFFLSVCVRVCVVFIPKHTGESEILVSLLLVP